MKEYEDTVRLRIAVLRGPHNQGMDEEERAFEKEGAPIYGLYENDELLGVGVLKFIYSHEIKINYMAVKEEARGKGVGRKILNAIIDYGKTHGYKKITLESRVSAQGFYEKAGFYTIGKSYLPDFVPVEHIQMEKNL